MDNAPFLSARFDKLITRLPAPYRYGRAPYLVFFVSIIIALLVLDMFITPYINTVGVTISLALFLAFLFVLVYWGVPLAPIIHMGTAASAAMLCYVAWHAGGVFSPVWRG